MTRRPRTLDDARLGRVPLYLVGNPDGFATGDTDPSNRGPLVDEPTQELPQVTPGYLGGDSAGRNWRERVNLAGRVVDAARRQDGSLLLLAQMYRAGYEDALRVVRERHALAEAALEQEAGEAALRFIDGVR